jgi:hypothetical protein
MALSPALADTAAVALESGRICGTAGRCQRDMRSWAAEYPGLYGSSVFDPALFSTLALAASFSGPWFDAEQLRMANRACLWCFGLDWLIDYQARDAAEVTGLVERCLAVADGGPSRPGDELTAFLADLRDELAAAPGFRTLGPIWREDLAATLEAMAREWCWKTAGTKPTLDEYLGNADNLGFSVVFTAHWAYTTAEVTRVAEVRAASRTVQQAIRLLNDLGTYERDLQWGDVNALLLGPDRAEISERIAALTEEVRRRTEPLPPQIGGYLRRQLDFCAGFYGISDYWGSL